MTQPQPSAPRSTPAAAVPVVVVTPDDPILQAIIAALNTALAAIHKYGVASTST